jgi:tetratricopeptide (TPR) repeat protein
MTHPIVNKIILKEFNLILNRKQFKSSEEKKKFIESLNDDSENPPLINPLPHQLEARNLVLQAEEMLDSEAAILVHRAIKIDSDCVYAYELLGNIEDNDNKAIVFYKKGIAIGRKTLGQDFFKENRGLFWSIPETRPFLRCMAGYAATLSELNMFTEAITVYEQILNLNIKDNLNVRHPLMLALLRLNNFKKFKLWETRFHNDNCIYFIYNRVLFYFKSTGDSEITNKLLKAAIKRNKAVVPVLISIKLNSGSITNDKEHNWAVIYSILAKTTWIETDGALNWLRKKINQFEPNA